MTLDEAVNAASSDTALPGELSKLHTWFAGEYGWMELRLTGILMQKPLKWTEIRKKTTSDKQADKIWDATEEGILETEMRGKIKVCSKLMSSVKTRIEVLQGEARGSY